MSASSIAIVWRIAMVSNYSAPLFMIYVFSSPEQNALVSYCHPFLSSLSCVVRKLFLFSSSSSKVLIGNQPNLPEIIPRGRGFKVIQMVHVAPMGVLGGQPRVKSMYMSNIFSRSECSRVTLYCVQIPLYVKNKICSLTAPRMAPSIRAL